MMAIYKVALVIRTGNGRNFSWSPLLSVVSGSGLFSKFGANMIVFTAPIERHRSGLTATVIYGQLAKNAAKICLVIKWQTKTYSDAIASLGLQMLDNLNHALSLWSGPQSNQFEMFKIASFSVTSMEF